MKLEERTRDLAEENLKKEITNCLKLLEVRIKTFGNNTFGHVINNISQIAYEFICMTETNSRHQALASRQCELTGGKNSGSG